MNKLCKTSKRAWVLTEKPFLCPGIGIRLFNGKKTVKQRGPSGTFLHTEPGITPHLGGKTRFSLPFLCERNENRFILRPTVSETSEQRPVCSVFNSDPVIKYFSRSCFF